MEDSESSTNESSSRASDKENVRGYTPRHCDLKCYKCRHQGDCVIPRRIIEARRRYMKNSRTTNAVALLNNRYGLNTVLNLRKYVNRFSTYMLTKLLKKGARNRRGNRTSQDLYTDRQDPNSRNVKPSG